MYGKTHRDLHFKADKLEEEKLAYIGAFSLHFLNSYLEFNAYNGASLQGSSAHLWQFFKNYLLVYAKLILNW